MKVCVFALALCGSLTMTHAQPTNTFPLWPGGAPGALGTEPKDVPPNTHFFPRG